MIARRTDPLPAGAPELDDDRGWFACYSRASERSLRSLQRDCRCECPIWTPKAPRARLRDGSGHLVEVLTPIYPHYYLIGFPLRGIAACPVRTQERRRSGTCQLPVDILPMRESTEDGAGIWSELVRPLTRIEISAIAAMEGIESVEELVGAPLIGKAVRLNEQAGAWQRFGGTMLDLVRVGVQTLAVVRVNIFGREQMIRVPVDSLEAAE